MESQIETTNLDSLPSNNVTLTASEKKEEPQLNVNNELISGIQKAASSGNTVLPSRDIPMDTHRVSQDEMVKPNFVPEHKEDYISTYQNNKAMAQEYEESQKNENKLESLYDQLAVPLLIAVLYFVFQLPVVQSYVQHLLPFAYSKAGSIKFTGRLIQSVVFAVLIYVSSRAILYLDR